MRITNLLALPALLLALLAAPSPATVRVVTTIPDLEDIARQIGGERVEVSSIARGTENIHSVPLRPSDLIRLNKADLFVQIGLSLEHSWVPGLLMAARNERIQPGQPGFVDCSVGWDPIEVPGSISRGEAVDIHPQGNPHINLDPRGGKHLATRIHAGLVAVDPAGQEHYDKGLAAWLERLEAAQKRWDETVEVLRGAKIVAYHSNYSYFARSRGLEVVDLIESRPGVPPAPADLAATIALMREQHVKLILTARWSNNKHVAFVAKKTGARIVEMPEMVGGVKAASGWIELMDYYHEQLEQALTAP